MRHLSTVRVAGGILLLYRCHIFCFTKLQISAAANQMHTRGSALAEHSLG